ncbi:MAG: hypothetical protein PHF00_12655 [Elusimicrobia bacterium]|nr:hypothetical protein [Elusimicrobiota bacterium]
MRLAALSREAVLAQEIAFSASMGVVVLFSRGNPALVYPRILWVFAGLLIFNLGYHALLRRGVGRLIPLASIAVNLPLVVLALAYSGGSDSLFWPMFFLPIFTACLHLSAVYALSAFAVSAVALAFFYVGPGFAGPFWLLLTLAVKVGVLGLATGVTMQISCQERKARRALAATRSELDRLACGIEDTHRSGGRSIFRHRLFEGLIYDMHCQLFSILGSAGVLLDQVAADSELRPDIERITGSTRSLHQLSAKLLDLAPAPEGGMVLSLDKLLGQVADLLEYKLRHRGIKFWQEIPADLPRLHQNGARLQLALLDLLLWVLDQTRPDGSVRMKAARADSGLELAIRCAPCEEEASFAALSVHARVLSRENVELRSRRDGPSCEIVLSFPNRERAPRKGAAK